MREQGSYWVFLNGLWTPATWVGDSWKIPGQYAEMMDEEFEKIDEKMLIPPGGGSGRVTIDITPK